MLIGDRYEVLEKIGTGGMSDVYKAKDQKLNRFVAVKVLKQEFSENRNFVSKFRVEAQAAAGLMHPNIVNVYDVGEENGIHYIVMELVEGITLKKYIEKKIRLSTKEAISIAIQVAMGIEAAHNNHIIHRDIKPQNIIISKEGKVKVTDFGIAKAASSNTITSNVMGSVHYTSPEQARGGFSDEKSDIYSLGITMFEMLTGRVPFNGDTTVAIAIKHIQDPMPSLREFVPEIPVSVENIVMKCTQKSPDKRYQCMADMIKDLKYSLVNPDAVIAVVDSNDEAGKTKVAPGPVNVPPVLETVWEDRVPKREVYADEAELVDDNGRINYQDNNYYDNYDNGDYQDDGGYYGDEQYYEETPKTHTVKKQVKKQPQTVAKNKTNKQKSNSSKAKANKNVKKSGYESYGQEKMNRQKVRQAEVYDGDFGGDEYDYNPKAEGFTTVLTIIMAVIIGGMLLYFAGQATGIFEQISSSVQGQTSSDSESERAVMPEFEGENIEDVKKALNSEGLGYKTTYVESTKYAKNRVISAALEDGTTVLANDKILMNTTIVLTVSAGADGVDVPSVIGMTEAEGTAALTQEGFKVVKTDEYSTDYAKGLIISQSPEGDSIAPLESEITIVISKGSDVLDVRIPDVMGKTKDTAVSMLEASGITVGVIEESYSSEYPAGQICYQSYDAGTTVSEGTSIDLKISLGAETITYNCSLTIQEPEGFAGGNAEVILTTADESKQLWYSQSVTSFPVSINLNGFESPSAYGTVIISYFKNVETPAVDADGNQTTQVTTELAQTRQTVQFTKN
jgi:serine/threonine-protein kinase